MCPDELHEAYKDTCIYYTHCRSLLQQLHSSGFTILLVPHKQIQRIYMYTVGPTTGPLYQKQQLPVKQQAAVSASKKTESTSVSNTETQFPVCVLSQHTHSSTLSLMLHTLFFSMTGLTHQKKYRITVYTDASQNNLLTKQINLLSHNLARKIQ